MNVVLHAGPWAVTDRAIGGIGLRIVEFAQVLSDAGHTVTIAADQPSDLTVPAIAAAHRRDLSVVGAADVAMFFDSPDLAALQAAHDGGAVVISENAAPIEHLEYPRYRTGADGASELAAVGDAYRHQLRHSHHFICRSDVERLTLIGNLAALGLITPDDVATDRRLSPIVSVVPIGFNEASRRRALATAPGAAAEFCWSGGLWEFYDPFLVVAAAKICRDRGSPVTVQFLYAAPQVDNRDVVARLGAQIADHDLAGHVSLRTAPLGHRARDELVAGCRGLICIAQPGIENETCIRLRLRDSLLYRRPLIVDHHGATGCLVREHGLGHAVAPDADAIADAMLTVVGQDPIDNTAAGGLARYAAAVAYDDTLPDVIATAVERAEPRRMPL